jgi:hypothetical protein
MTVYYVDTAVGDDGNAGTSEGAGNAWATIQKAMDTVVAGDKVWIKASGTYDENADVVTAGAGNSFEILFEGYSSIPGDDGRVTWKNSSGTALTDTVGSAYCYFRNFDFNGSSSTGVSLNGFYGFENCIFQNNGVYGVNGSSRFCFLNCEFYNNSNYGAFFTSFDITVIGCIFGGNASGLRASTRCVVYKTLFYNNANAINVNNDGLIALGNTLDGDNVGGTGITIGGNMFKLIVDNIIYDFTVGVSQSATVGAELATAVVDYNLVNDNNTDYSIAGANWRTQGQYDVTTAPAFTDEANDDYTLDSASPARAAGAKPGVIS